MTMISDDKSSAEKDNTVVISGFSGVFPGSKNLSEFAENLKNKVNLVTDIYDNAFAIGKIPDIDKFDAKCFGINDYADAMDPMGRLLLEKACEAIFDSGYNPQALRGRKIGVFIGVYLSETEVSLMDYAYHGGQNIAGVTRNFLANRISCWLDFTGPSMCVDTACSSSMFAIHSAYRAIATGECEAAIVGGCNICLTSTVSIQLLKAGVLSPTGKACVLDEKANGYCRAEAVCVAFLQKAADARRIYAKMLNSKVNNDGYKPEGIAFPSFQMQQRLFLDAYEECNLKPNEVSWLELHATGTRVGDLEEAKALEVFCKDRGSPLMIGSVKSNMGHAEAAAGLCSVAKIILCMQTNNITPNINFEVPRQDIDLLTNNNLKVITENTPWSGGKVGMSGFGLGGSNGHVILQSYEKQKVNNGRPTDDMPRIINVSGRNEEAVDTLLTNLEENPLDVEYVRLLHEIYSVDFTPHNYRGYTIIDNESKVIDRNIQQCLMKNRPLWFIFPGLGSQYLKVAKDLMKIPIFARSIEKCHKVLQTKNMDLLNNIDNSEQSSSTENIVDIFTGITSVQIALVDTLRSVGISPSGIIGHSAGEIACSYADGCLDIEQTILSAYYRGHSCLEAGVIEGLMASIGLPVDELKKKLPQSVDLVCLNNPDNCTISGPKTDVENFVRQLQKENVFARIVGSGGVPFHGRYVQTAKDTLLKYMKTVIQHPKPRTDRWITTVPNDRNHDLSSCSAEYHAANLIEPVYFEDAVKRIPENAIVLEIAPHCCFQTILKPILGDNATYIPVTKKTSPDHFGHFLSALGRLYMESYNMKLDKLYPEVQFPVSNGTRMIAPLIKWQHDKSWGIAFQGPRNKTAAEKKITIILNSREQQYIHGHVIDGKCLFPGFGYIAMVWECLSMMCGYMPCNTSIIFEDVRFLRPVAMHSTKNNVFFVQIHKEGGKFEISEDGSVMCTGQVYIPDDVDREMFYLPPRPNENDHTAATGDQDAALTQDDIYKYFGLRGYQYSGLFKQILRANSSGSAATVKWNNNWAAFLDLFAQLYILQSDSRNPALLTAIERLVINLPKHKEILENSLDNARDLDMRCDLDYGVTECGGVQIKGISGQCVPRKTFKENLTLLEYKFYPYFRRNKTPVLQFEDVATICACLLWDNVLMPCKKIIELVDSESITPIVENIASHIKNYPLIQVTPIIIANKTNEEKFKNIRNVSIEWESCLPSDQSAHLVILTNATGKYDIFEAAVNTLSKGGFLMLRGETTKSDRTFFNMKGLNICFDATTTEKERVIILKKIQTENKARTIAIRVTNKSFEWITELQNILSHSESSSDIVLYSQNEPYSGILGFFTCFKKEVAAAHRLRCVFVADEDAPTFSVDEPFYSQQLSNGLCTNVLQDGSWGCYSHSSLPTIPLTKTAHAYVRNKSGNDFSCLKWYSGNIASTGLTNNHNNSDNNNNNNNGKSKIIRVCYASLNFRDVLFATNVLSYEGYLCDRVMQENMLGCECSGYDKAGTRYMGMCASGSISTLIETSPSLLWEVPNDWSLEDAATVPVAYMTVIAGFFVQGGLKKGDSVLIHSGSGGVGQAAINIATHYQCTIFTTVGTEKKREFIKNLFPHIDDDHIGNSRDTSFECMVMKGTKGKGVKYVLNSLAEDKLLASLRCLSFEGHFVEIGKMDLMKNNPIGLQIFLKGISLHCVLLDYNLHNDKSGMKSQIIDRFKTELKNGSVKPIVRTVFSDNEVEMAFRYMAAGKHIGKVLIKIGDPSSMQLPPAKEAIPEFHCKPDGVYIICGGLGGIGLELADWLVIRGAKKLVLTSRTGITNGFQQMSIKLWQSRGVNVIISTSNITAKSGVQTLIQTANSIGPVIGIFNLAAELIDNLIENQKSESFQKAVKPKGLATFKLDKVSRQMCPHLEHFVVFSSVSCGLGSESQTNYGFANCIMERICENRVRNKLPALAIQWGPIGDVGIMLSAPNAAKSVGLVEQPIRSCLDVLDTFLCQNKSTIVASYIVRDMQTTTNNVNNDLITIAAHILGIKDTIDINPDEPLSNYGTDSITALEFKQVLEQQYDTFLSYKEIISLTFAKLKEIEKRVKKGQK